MANFHTGSVNVFTDAMFAQTHPATLQFLQQQLEAPTMVIDSMRQTFMSAAQNAFEAMHGSTAMRLARAALRGVENYWQANVIQPLYDIGAFQHATPVMQRWVMAEPLVRERYLQQRVDGYHDTYVNIHGTDVGPDHYDYRRVMNGVVVFDEETDNIEEQGWSATTYFDEIMPEDRELTIEEQDDILTTWQHVRDHILRGKEDPTSRWNAELG